MIIIRGVPSKLHFNARRKKLIAVQLLPYHYKMNYEHVSKMSIQVKGTCKYMRGWLLMPLFCASFSFLVDNNKKLHTFHCTAPGLIYENLTMRS